MPSEVEKAWLAGVLDTTTSRPGLMHKRAYYHWGMHFPHVEIANRVFSLIGAGSVGLQSLRSAKFLRMNCAEHCPEKHTHVNVATKRVAARYSISGCIIPIVLFGVREHLTTPESFKTEEYLQRVMETDFRRRASGPLSRMKNKGWDLTCVGIGGEETRADKCTP